MKKINGSISIYFVFAIILIISVVLSVTEIARINCQKLYLQIATNASIDSMLSLYHRNLYEYYDIYGVEYYTDELLNEEYKSYVNLFLYTDNGTEQVNNWYKAEIDDESNLNYKLLIDETNFEKEIVAFMKYKLVGSTIDFFGKTLNVDKEEDINEVVDLTSEVFDETSKSDVYKEIYSRYFDFASDIKILENYSKNIKKYIDNVNSKVNLCKATEATGTSSNGKIVKRKLNDVIAEFNSLIIDLNNYKVKMNEFRDKVNNKRETYEDDVASGRYDFTDDVKEFIEEEFDEFVSFVDENSDMNQSVEKKKNEVNELINTFNEYITSVSNYINEIESIESQIDDAKREKGEDRDNDLIRALNQDKRDTQLEFGDYIKELKQDLKDVKIDNIDIDVSTGNHSREENLLNSLININEDAILGLVLSAEELSKLNSDNISMRDIDVLSNNNTISLEKILLGEYELNYFNYYNKDLNDEITRSESTSLEVERLINGRNSDKSNLKSTIAKILLIRTALNVVYIYKSPEKRRIAREFAYITFGGFSRILAEVMFLVIMSAWGVAQGIVDIKKLLNNKKVKFMHDDNSWEVDIDSILSIASGNAFDNEGDGDSGLAFSYKDYLRLLLINERQDVINGRMLGIIEENIKKEQDNFSVDKLIYSFSANNFFTCKHFFTNFVFVKAKDVALYDEYKINTEAYGSFVE